jgi:threonylcarbamoyladenosine tRNA methylthiotransferase MtaB
VEQLATVVPGIAVTGDVIVGFPGEDAEAFRKTYKLLESLPMAGLHVFSYSRRPGTDAAAYPDQVPRSVKAERSRMLRDLAGRKARAFRHRTIGDVLETVVLRREGGPGTLQGLSDNYIRVGFPGDSALQGTVVRVRAERVTAQGVLGSLESLGTATPRPAWRDAFSSENSRVSTLRDSVDSPKTVQ